MVRYCDSIQAHFRVITSFTPLKFLKAKPYSKNQAIKIKWNLKGHSNMKIHFKLPVMIVTVPSPLVDIILALLRFFGLIDAMTLEQHYGFEPRQTVPLFTKAGFRITKHRKFELGLNNLFVFKK